MMESDADRLEMIRALGGISVTVDGKEVEGIFESEYEGTPVGDTIVQNRTPQLSCRTSDIPKATTRSIVQVASVAYAVLADEPDGTGMTLLRLERL